MSKYALGNLWELWGRAVTSTELGVKVPKILAISAVIWARNSHIEIIPWLFLSECLPLFPSKHLGNYSCIHPLHGDDLYIYAVNTDLTA